VVALVPGAEAILLTCIRFLRISTDVHFETLLQRPTQSLSS
jgi:hypothetical protein